MQDVSFISMLAEHLLLTYIEQGDLSHLALLDSLGESILLSPKLTFLGKEFVVQFCGNIIFLA